MGQTSKQTWTSVAETFLEFFRAHGHTVVPSSSLVPANDPTLLFTNAGMVQFKDTFLGRERRPYARAASLQKCMRVQGKHNDLETVGPSPWHHTFFQMLGNFSFGDYFKRDAVAYAWEVMTQAYGIDPERLVITVFEPDDEAYTAWKALGLPDSRILRMGEETNFWMMADVGPCGPTSELHYDWGPQHCTCRRPDCGVALGNGCGRWLEAWNLVFMQFDQRPDGTRVPLPRPGVDTGMGLERMVSIMQGVHDNYATDMFMPIMDRLQRIRGDGDQARREHALSYRVMADHGRAATFLLADGVVPGNEGRGYVLRMIMRRAMRFAKSTGNTRPFLGDLAGAVIEEMKGVYPELETQRSFIEAAARSEEERFAQTLTAGLERLEELIASTLRQGRKVLSGEEVFRLYDTYGFPVEMTRDVARERSLEVDEAAFKRAMEVQRERARGARHFVLNAEPGAYSVTGYPVGIAKSSILADEGLTTEFVGYTKLNVRGRITALFIRGSRGDKAGAGDEVEVVLDRTPFYPEGGGQVGDTGVLTTATGSVTVEDTKRAPGGIILHLGAVERGAIRVGQPVRAIVEAARRLDIMRNHTATHLLHQALREVLGEHARQAGSLVAPDRLRFDFVHLTALTAEQREAVERIVNEKILADLTVRGQWLSYEEAVKKGAMALFGEKYGDRVRMISIDHYSRELCGGTHLSRTGRIGLFKITSESAVASGVRRVEAVTGRGALAWIARREAILRELGAQLRSSPEEVLGKVRQLAERVKDLERNLEAERALSHARSTINIFEHAVQLGSGESVIVERTHAREPGQLRNYADNLKREMDSRDMHGAIVLASDSSGAFVVSSNSDIHAGEFAHALAEEFGGSGGGGGPTMGQGGFKDPARVEALINEVRDPAFIKKVLAKINKPP